MRLTAKFTLLLLIAVLVLMAVDGYWSVRREIQYFDNDMQLDAQQMTYKLGPLITDVFKRGGQQRVLELLEQANEERQLLEQPGSENRVVRVRWVFLDAQSNEPHSPKAAINEMEQAVNRQMFSVRQTDNGEEHLLTYAQVAIGGDRRAALELDETITHSGPTMRSFASRMLTMTAITLMLSLGMVVLLGSELVAKPLNTLIEKTRRIGRGDLSGPVHLQRRDEFGELAEAINSMCEQLVDAQNKATQETAGRIAALEQLRHADRLRTVGRLASGVAHELGTPLNVVGGRASMIASGKLSDKEVKKSADVIKSESDRITNIIRQLLDFARRKTPKRTSVDLRQLVDQTVDLLAPLAEKKGVKIECIAESKPFRCPVDTGQIQQVITNLLVNAVQAMPDGGRVDIDIRCDHFESPDSEEARAGDFLLLAVRDDGRGIAEEDLEQLFEPFFTTKEVGEGTGLGLSIAHGIVQEHGGWIDVQSEVDKGSCFTVYLPLGIDA